MLLSIMKWIGIVLLILLGLILLILGLVLFVPVCYLVQGSFLSNTLKGKAHAGWLFGFLQLDAVYPDDTDQENGPKIIFRILGIPFERHQDTEDKGDEALSREEGPSSSGPDIRPPEDDELPKESEAVSETAPPDQAEPASLKLSSSEQNAGAFGEDTSDPSGSGAGGNEEAEGIFERSLHRILEIYEDISTTLRAVYRVISQKQRAASKLLDIYKAKENGPAFQLLKRMLFMVLRELTPRKGSGKLIIGTGDPYTTAQVLEIMLLLTPSPLRQIEVVPDFDNEIHDFDGSLRGRVHIAVLLWAVGRVLLNKKIRNIYKQAKKIVQLELLGPGAGPEA